MKARYTEYDYEELYNQSIDGWDEQMAANLLERARGVYATKEVSFGGQMDGGTVSGVQLIRRQRSREFQGWIKSSKER